MDLRQATRQIMSAHDSARWLKLADHYMQAYRKLPSSFILPSDHAILKPVIDAFANDTKAFVMYVKAIRDGSKGSPSFDELHELYRTIDIRVLQGERRDRIRRAVALLQNHYAPTLKRDLTYDEQVTVAKYVEAAWKAMRIADAKTHRALRASRSMTLEEQEIVYNQFWASIEAALEKGEVPLEHHADAIDEFIAEAAKDKVHVK